MQKKNEKSIPIKNYVLLLVLFLLTFLLVYYLYRWYVVYSDYQSQIPVIREYLSEVTEQEMEHYIQENPTAVVYVCTAADIECRNFEKNFKKLVEKDSLKDYVTYVNLTDENKDTFVERFNQKYPHKKIKLTNYPAIIVFEDGIISDILQADEDDKMSVTEVKQFLKSNKVGSKYE